MSDITKEYLDGLKEEFYKKYSSSKKIQNLEKLLKDGKATCEDAFQYSKEVGNLIKLVLHENITDEILTDGYLGYMNALSIFNDVIHRNHELINQYCQKTFTQINKQAGINLKGVSVEYDQNKTDGIVECAVKDKYINTRAEIEEAVVTNAKTYYDSSVRKNADFQYKSGLNPKIIRTAVGKTCKWCKSLAGTYDYYDVSDTGNDVFRRHRNCDCLVVYSPRKGKYQDAHSKQWMDSKEYEEERIKRIDFSKYEEYTKRKIGERGKEICDKPTYNKITKEFLKHDGLIIRGDVAKKHLDSQNAGASYFWGANVAYIRDDATVSEVLEEMYHAQQDRKNLLSNYPKNEVYYRREIDAQDYLLSIQKRYKMSLKEVEEIKENRRYWISKLKEVTGE